MTREKKEALINFLAAGYVVIAWILWAVFLGAILGSFAGVFRFAYRIFGG